MCISFAVMLPVGNPPNAIVFSYGHCQIKDMVSHGCLFLPGPAARTGMTGSTASPEVYYFVAVVLGLLTLNLV